jgi:hypothetical protein
MVSRLLEAMRGLQNQFVLSGRVSRSVARDRLQKIVLQQRAVETLPNVNLLQMQDEILECIQVFLCLMFAVIGTNCATALLPSSFAATFAHSRRT